MLVGIICISLSCQQKETAQYLVLTAYCNAVPHPIDRDAVDQSLFAQHLPHHYLACRGVYHAHRAITASRDDLPATSAERNAVYPDLAMIDSVLLAATCHVEDSKLAVKTCFFQACIESKSIRKLEIDQPTSHPEP